MKICIVQARSVKGDIPHNIDNHKKIIALAVSHGAGTIIFPELSITGYEPTLAEALAMDPNDSQLDDFQQISDTSGVTIGVGAPTKNNTGTCITMIIFHPHQPRQTYSKKYLHADEEPFFVSGKNSTSSIRDTSIALAICYELSVPEHSENAFMSGAGLYVASVAKTPTGVEKAIKTLSGIANSYSMTVLMSNCVGQCDGDECGGKTSVWNNKGVLTGQLNSTDEGILIIDMDTKELIEINNIK